MGNPLPKITSDCELSFHTVLGVYGALQSLCQQENSTLLHSYDRFKSAFVNKCIFISVNDKNQPDGILFWKNDINEFDRDLRGSLRGNKSYHGPVIYSYISPFKERQKLFTDWKNHLQLNNYSCWLINDDKKSFSLI